MVGSVLFLLQGSKFSIRCSVAVKYNECKGHVIHQVHPHSPNHSLSPCHCVCTCLPYDELLSQMFVEFELYLAFYTSVKGLCYTSTFKIAFTSTVIAGLKINKILKLIKIGFKTKQCK